MRKYRTDYWLWVILFWPAFLALGFLPGADLGSFWANVRRLALRQGVTADVVGLVAFQLLTLVPLSVVAGWALQAGAQMCGVHLRGRPSKEHAADYGNAPPEQSR